MKPRYIIAILLVVALLCSSFSMFTFADSTNCVEISNAQELLQYVFDYNSGIKKDAVLTADIVLNDTSDDEWYNADGLTLWVPIKKYANVFDGKGHTIEGIYYNNTTTKTGYEGYGFIEDNGGALTVKNVAFVNGRYEFDNHISDVNLLKPSLKTANNGASYTATWPSVPGWSFVGGIIGKATNSTTIENVYVDIDVQIRSEATNIRAGGICGKVRKGGELLLDKVEYSGTLFSDIEATELSVKDYLGQSLSVDGSTVTLTQDIVDKISAPNKTYNGLIEWGSCLSCYWNANGITLKDCLFFSEEVALGVKKATTKGFSNAAASLGSATKSLSFSNVYSTNSTANGYTNADYTLNCITTESIINNVPAALLSNYTSEGVGIPVLKTFANKVDTSKIFIDTAFNNLGAALLATDVDAGCGMKISTEIRGNTFGKQNISYGMLVVPSEGVSSGELVLGSLKEDKIIEAAVESKNILNLNEELWKFGSDSTQINVDLIGLNTFDGVDARTINYMIRPYVIVGTGDNAAVFYGNTVYKTPVDIAIQAYKADDNKETIKAIYGDIEKFVTETTFQEGLVAFWDFNSFTDDGKVKDVSNNGHDGDMINNPTITTVNDDKYLTLNGVDQSVSVPYSSKLDFKAADDFTLSVWVKSDGKGGYQLIAGNGRASGKNWYAIYANGKANYEYSANAPWDHPTITQVKVDEWQHLTVVHDGKNSMLYLYADGQKVGEIAAKGNMANGSLYGFLIGGTNSEFFKGGIDNVRVYNRQLSESEISAIFNEEKQNHNNMNEEKQYVQHLGSWEDPGESSIVKNIIFDSDAGPDVDDTAALTMLHQYANEGKINLLATVSSTSGPYGAPFLSAMNTYFGRPDVLVGTQKSDLNILPTCRDYNFNINITAQFETGVVDGPNTRDAVDVYREALSKAEDNSVTIVVVGMQTNMMNLLKSEPDKWSNLNGYDLVAKKVCMVSCMGGEWSTDGVYRKEFNITNDGVAAKYVADNWPSPIMYSGFEIGKEVYTGPDKNKIEADSPVLIGWRFAQSWDQTSVLYAVEGLSDYWTMVRGDVDFTTDGKNRLAAENETAGARAYLVKKASPESVAAAIHEKIFGAKKNTSNDVIIQAIDSLSMTTVGEWNTEAFKYSYGESVISSSQSGAVISATFTGNVLHIYGGKGTDFGTFDIYIDDVLKGTCDSTDAVTPAWASQHLATVSGLTDEQHTVKIVLKEDKKVSIDFFKTEMAQ